LSAREFEVLDRVLAGKTATVIARELGISPRTVEAHRKHVFSKTGSSNLIELGELSRLAGRGSVSG
jgi:DNA-binding CsgD family transcriptional regulator